MADKKISELTSATIVNTTDLLVLVQAGTTLKLDIATLLSHLPSQPIVIQVQESPVSGALSTTNRVSLVTSASGITNYTLAAATHGTKKHIAAATMAGTNAIVTVTNGIGFTTLTLNAAGDSVTLENINGYWYITGNNSVAVA